MKKYSTDYSIIRDEEYKNLTRLSLDGSVLDIGGSKRSGYHELLAGDHVITTVNLNPDYGCDLVFDIQNTFPLKDASFDHVLCLNVLEHVYGVDNVVKESFRVLKKGGSAIFATPFMFHVHGSPDDYFRFTRSALQKMFTERGFSTVEIKEMGNGLFSLVFQCIEPATPFFSRSLIKKFFVFADNFFSRVVPKYGVYSRRIPLGYFVVARK